MAFFIIIIIVIFTLFGVLHGLNLGGFLLSVEYKNVRWQMLLCSGTVVGG